MTARARRWLLRICREALACGFLGKPVVVPQQRLGAVRHGGAFVTLRCDGEIRGCMGSVSPVTPVLQTVQRAALSAATDPRFAKRPLGLEELARLQFEIAVLSPLRRTDHPARLMLGRHGVVIRRDEHQGCFLPQVGSTLGVSAQAFLSRCCTEKAGLHPDAWKEPQTHVYLFTTECCRGPFNPSLPAKILDLARDTRRITH